MCTPLRFDTRITCLLILGALVATIGATSSAQSLAGDALLASLSDATRRELRSQGQSMIPTGSPHGAEPGSSEQRIWVGFALERNAVMRQLIQSARQTEYRPELSRVLIVEDFENGQVCDYHMRIMLMTVRYRVRHHWDFEAGTFWWELDPSFGNDLSILEGRWELYPRSDGGTLARFITRIDIGALPAWLQDYATRTKLPESIGHVREWVDSKGAFRP